ncbi:MULTISPECIES: SDR family oxidoreductase [Nocardioides]|uniref:SDR family oxidoreductase n=1 Tax=Nocardioides vastitatis TaxID=2568655 RepID=A0ABW0ZL61_9ACTN|nr:SDR family oxidoreductase [Nocardioides sp.]THI92735.1 SDR family oxidoreductase [Nocardioides sp.]
MTRNVIIAGAGPGVSGSLARIYAEEGSRLGLLGVEQSVLAALTDRVAEAGGSAESVVVDLTDDAATRAAVTQMGEHYGSLDVVHFNPSVFREKDPLALTPDELLADVRLGVGALLTLVQAARPFLGPGARISVTGSMAADKPWFGAASLGVQKAGVRNLVHSLDAVLKNQGIRAVSVTVRGTLTSDGPFTPDRVAAALRAAIDQDEASWATELPYDG